MDIFVYGTLLTDEPANGLITQYAELVGAGTLNTSDFLLCLPPHGLFPAIVRLPSNLIRSAVNRDLINNVSIRGEVWRIEHEHNTEALYHLDMYEGYPHLYHRQRFVIDLDCNAITEAIAYFMPYDDEILTTYSLVTSGSWKDRAHTCALSDIPEIPDKRPMR